MFARIDGREMRGGQPTRETDNRFGRGKPVQRIEDLRLLNARPGAPIAGAILGRSLYAGTIKAGEALAIAGSQAG